MDIAHDVRLLPKSIDWAAKKEFVENFLEHVETSIPPFVSKRYNYRELQLRRLNTIHKCCPSVLSLDNLRYSFLHAPMWYGFFLERNITHLFTIFAFSSLVLSAMQVGQGTPSLRDSTRFSSASYGFSVATIVLVLLVF